MAKKISSAQNRRLNFLFWITLIRGVLGLLLGFSLLFIPNKTFSMLYNFMGFFWLMTGIVMIRQETHLKRNRLLLILGISAVLTGALVLARYLMFGWFRDYLIINLLGAVILITGIIHVAYGVQSGRQAMRRRTEVSITLGIIEIGFGGLIMITDTATSQFVFTIAIIWALMGGTLLIIDAFRQRQKVKPEG